MNNPERPYSDMLEAAQRKLVEAQFFYRRLVSERDGRLVESTPFHILQQRSLDRLGIGPRQGVALLAPASLSLGVTQTHAAMLTPLRNGIP